jgi:hypothetical protein
MAVHCGVTYYVTMSDCIKSKIIAYVRILQRQSESCFRLAEARMASGSHKR